MSRTGQGAGALVALIVAASSLWMAMPAQASPFSALAGSWSGTGTVSLADGKRESIRCRAYYTLKSGGAALGLAIRCASPVEKIEMRADLTHSGNAVSGSWEERTFNATGEVSGSAAPAQLKLAIAGAITGFISIIIEGSTQKVSISTQGTNLRGVTINLAKSG